MNTLRENRPLAAAVVIGALTLIVTTLPFVDFTYDNPALHLALETSEGLIAALLAYLAAKRYRATGRLQDVALAWVFSLLAFVNLVVSAGPLVAERGRRDGWLTWAALGFRVAAAALCAAAHTGGRRPPQANAPLRRRRVHRGHRADRRSGRLGRCYLGGRSRQPGLSPADRTRQWVVGHPAVPALRLVIVGCFAAAARSDPAARVARNRLATARFMG